MKIFWSLVLHTLVIIVAAYLIPGIYIQSLLIAFLVAIVFAIVNTFIKPIVHILALPITIVTLGIFALVINALFVLLVALIVPGFQVDGFWPAFFFSITVSIIGVILRMLI